MWTGLKILEFLMSIGLVYSEAAEKVLPQDRLDYFWRESNISIIAPRSDYTPFSRLELEPIYYARKGREKMSDFLNRLPRSFRAVRMEIYNSQSLHCATPIAPRMVMFSMEGLFCSFNSGKISDYEDEGAFLTGTPNAVCSESINQMECLQFNPKTSRMETFTLEFLNEEGPLPPGLAEKKIISSPQACTTCHFDGRGIIDPYFTWPGFYGSSDDGHALRFMGQPDGNSHFAAPTKEVSLYDAFLSVKNKNIRYKALPDFREKSFGSYSYKGARPNLLATYLLSEFNIHRVAQIIREAAEPHTELLPMIAGLLLRCRMDEFLPEGQRPLYNSRANSLKGELASNSRDLLISSFQRQANLVGEEVNTREGLYLERYKGYGTEPARYQEAANFYALLEPLGISLNQLPLNFAGLMAPKSEVIDGFPIVSHLEKPLLKWSALKEMMDQVPMVEVQLSGPFLSPMRPPGASEEPKTLTKDCDWLATKSREALEKKPFFK